MINKIKIINNELVVSLIMSPEEFEKENNFGKNDFIKLEKYDKNKILDFDKSNKSKYVILDFINNKFQKKDVENFSNIEIKNNYRILFLKHEDLNKNFDYLMNETLVLLIDKNINLDNI